MSEGGEKRRRSKPAWLARRRRDSYAESAQKLGLRSRSVYKLMEMDGRFGFLRRKMWVIELGAAPGGWSGYVARRLGRGGVLIAVDVRPYRLSIPLGDEPLCRIEAVCGEVGDDATFYATEELLVGKADVVLSDMAASASGHGSLDRVRHMALAFKALAFARGLLVQGGTFLCKAFQGEDLAAFECELRACFDSLRRLKPSASRRDSPELYILAQGFKGCVVSGGSRGD